jgi:hypothetical protein
MNSSFRYWCQVNLSLKDIAQLLTEPFEFSKCEHDYENVFEWFEAKDADGFLWNVSRKHDGDGQPSFKDYLIISRNPVSQATDKIGQKLSNVLLSSVSYGEGSYGISDTWKYVVQTSFTPTDK